MGRPKKSVDVVKQCRNCGLEFTVPEWELRRRERKYCSNQCRADYQTRLVDEGFFAIPSSNMAYVLGLAMADGCILKRGCGREVLSIKSIDKDLLETVNVLMKSQYGVYDCGQSSAGNTVWRIDIANKKVVGDIQEWGVVPKKTFVATYPAGLPQCLAPDFIRGLFDGDGHVSSGRVKDKGDSHYRRLSFLGTQLLMNAVATLLPVDVTPHPYRKIARLCIHNRSDMQRVYEFMYYDSAVPCLARKRLAFDKLLSTGKEDVWVCGFERDNGGIQKVPGYRRKRVFYGKRSAENRRKKKEAEQK